MRPVPAIGGTSAFPALKRTTLGTQKITIRKGVAITDESCYLITSRVHDPHPEAGGHEYGYSRWERSSGYLAGSLLFGSVTVGSVGVDSVPASAATTVALYLTTAGSERPAAKPARVGQSKPPLPRQPAAHTTVTTSPSMWLRAPTWRTTPSPPRRWVLSHRRTSAWTTTGRPTR